MAGRLQLFNSPGEMGTIGQVWFVESLTDDDAHTARRLRENLQDLLAARSRRLPVEIRVQHLEPHYLKSSMSCAPVESSGLNPILDIECHGNDERGLILADETWVPWGELKCKLEAINLASRCNLILVLGCCFRAYFAREGRLHERAVMNAYIAPTEQIDVRVLEAGLHAFYAELLTSLDITRTIHALRLASPTLNYIFSTAYRIFRTVSTEVIRYYGMGEGSAERAASMAARLLAERGHHKALDSVANILKNREPQAFSLFYRTYFATDLFPENAERFTLTYFKVKADAEAMLAAKSITKYR